MTSARFETFDPARALDIYRNWFSDFSNFTFVIVGTVSLDSLRPLVAQWIGGLPSTDAKRTWKDVGPLPPDGAITKIVRKGKEPVSDQEIRFTGPVTATDAMTTLAADAAGEILQERLLDRLREAMGATYGVEVSSGVDAVPRPGYHSTISFKSTPAQADTLWKAAQNLIGALQQTGPTADEMEKFVAQQRRSSEVAVKTNDFWLGEIGDHVMADGGATNRPLSEILDWSKRLDALTPAMVQDAARKYFDPARVARFVLLPEATGGP